MMTPNTSTWGCARPCADSSTYIRGGVSITDYHEQWNANKDLAEEFGYKVGESDRATDWVF